MATDLNIGRVFSDAAAKLEGYLAGAAPQLKADVTALFSGIKDVTAGVVAAIEPNLDADVQALETSLDVALNLFATSKLGPAGGEIANTEGDALIKAAGDTAITKINQWVAANTTTK